MLIKGSSSIGLFQLILINIYCKTTMAVKYIYVIFAIKIDLVELLAITFTGKMPACEVVVLLQIPTFS